MARKVFSELRLMRDGKLRINQAVLALRVARHDRGRFKDHAQTARGGRPAQLRLRPVLPCDAQVLLSDRPQQV